ncbi:MAG: hypothetical protein U0165_17025 [Polyangiaceae bacterium]
MLKLTSSMTLFGDLAERLDRIEPAPDLKTLASGSKTILDEGVKQGYFVCILSRTALDEFDWSSAGL